jgi:chromosome segregation ATPase
MRKKGLWDYYIDRNRDNRKLHQLERKMNIIRKTLKKVGLNLSSSSSPTRPSSQTNTLEQLKSLNVPTTNVQEEIKERDETLRKLREGLQKSIREEKEYQEKWDSISRKIGQLKKREEKRTQRNLSHLEQQKKIFEVIEKAGIPISSDKRTLKKIEHLASPPNVVKLSEEDLEREIGSIPLRNIGRRIGGAKKGRKTMKHKKVRFTK